jgi:hypothetical protein
MRQSTRLRRRTPHPRAPAQPVSASLHCAFGSDTIERIELDENANALRVRRCHRLLRCLDRSTSRMRRGRASEVDRDGHDDHAPRPHGRTLGGPVGVCCQAQPLPDHGLSRRIGRRTGRGREPDGQHAEQRLPVGWPAITTSRSTRSAAAGLPVSSPFRVPLPRRRRILAMDPIW